MNQQKISSKIGKECDETYRKVFNEIVDIMHNDYAGCEDKADWDQPDFYLGQIKDIDDNKFVDLVQEYLLDFKDLHTGFDYINKPKKDIGFTVRRFEDHLYITSIKKEERLKMGDKVIALDGKGISEIAKENEKQLRTDVHERQKWESVLSLFQKAEIETKQGDKRILELNTYDPTPYDPEYSVQQLQKDILYMKLTDFMNHDALNQLIRNNEDKISTYPYLIIDVRVNRGGSDLAYFELLPYVFDGEKVDIRNFSNETTLTNCTKRNVSIRLQMLQGALDSIEDKETRDQIYFMIEELESHRGEGFKVDPFVKTRNLNF
ncbi:S41 family peptidase [Pontibacillus sp. HMF3514]|uniref:S41 family peptidase n=1 Tax=Pontibacillus sp. HMF3514 TaxID=2692425 RepID=UPI00131F9C8C|nr:S41 family peptidase [Pontibacillus sp. HMF3514]QHE52772.1 hypothetical protein GS400_12370 [Pontibacillus sp. HMF3514]